MEYRAHGHKIPNWRSDEVLALAHCINSNYWEEIVIGMYEDGKVDKLTKKIAWEGVATAVIAVRGVQRTWRDCKAKYKYYKSAMKKKLADRSRHLEVTGESGTIEEVDELNNINGESDEVKDELLELFSNFLGPFPVSIKELISFNSCCPDSGTELPLPTTFCRGRHLQQSNIKYKFHSSVVGTSEEPSEPTTVSKRLSPSEPESVVKKQRKNFTRVRSNSAQANQEEMMPNLVITTQITGEDITNLNSTLKSLDSSLKSLDASMKSIVSSLAMWVTRQSGDSK